MVIDILSPVHLDRDSLDSLEVKGYFLDVTSVGLDAHEDSVTTMTTSTRSVVLTGLTPNTTYYYQAKSADPSNAVATDNSGGDGYSFATLAGPAISNTSASAVQNTTVTITWNTDINSDSTVYYSTNSDMSGYTVTPTDTDSVKEHSVDIADLTLGTKYYFYVKSGVATDNNGGDYYYFNTTSDSVAPVITSVATDVITDDDVVIEWTTDEAANSQVYFGSVEGVYTSSTRVTSDYNISHSIVITPLANSSRYFYVVTSVDQSGNSATSTVGTEFTTLEQLSTEAEVVLREGTAADVALEGFSCSGGGGGSSGDWIAPKITKVNVSSEDSDLAKITWETSENAISVIQFGVDNTDENSIISSKALEKATRLHEMNITGLLPETIYKYKVLAIDTGGNIGEVEEATFSTGSFLADSGDGGLDGGEGEGEGTATDDSFLNTVEQATSFFEKMSSEVSLGTFKSGVIEHVSDLASFVPPPIISGEPALTVGASAASIGWTTDKESNSIVSYASANYYENNVDYEHTLGDLDALTNTHEVNLIGLEPEAIYHYNIESESPSGASAKSKDFSFVTLAELAEIESYTTDIISTEEVVFKWVTTVPTDSNVSYTPYKGGNLAVEDKRTEKNEILTTIHQLTVDGLEAGVLYQVEMYGNTQNDSTIAQTIPSFATSDDNLPPIIRQVKTDAALSLGKETKVQAIISWYTNEPSTSRVYYEEGAGNAGEELTKTSPRDENYARHHVVVITNFNPGAIYRFQVESTDTEGNSSRSRTYTILTPKQQESVFQVIMRNVEETFGWLEAFK
ncbi:fibronectin type III domain-containing protein [Candidatus Parcubacteria bacterium]|nr:fibronectin type III domain-containing protein [Candidatus Parcubacteria bacterium]